jgi:hypothetical protein
MTAATLKPLTDPDKAVHKEYAANLEKLGFCTIDDEKSFQTPLLNRKNGKRLPLSFIANDFRNWRRASKKDCVAVSAAYVLAALPHVIGTKFIPQPLVYFTEPQTGCTFVNTYRPYEPTTDATDVSPIFLEFFQRLAPDERERHIFVQWLAHAFQRPHERPSWHCLLTSDTGTGKGFLVNEILHPLLRHTSIVADYKQVMGRFSSVLEDNLLVLIDDAKARSDATQTQLKSLLSEERTYVERKGLQGGMVPTYARFILASNEHRPLFLDAAERRWFVLARVEHRHDRQETQAFIQSLADWLSLPGSLCRVYNWFMSYPLDGFNHKSVPDSAGLAVMVAMSRSPYADGIAEFVAESSVFTYAELVQGLKELGLTKLPGDRELGHLIREAGFHARRTQIDGKQINLYRPDGMLDGEARHLRTAQAAF